MTARNLIQSQVPAGLILRLPGYLHIFPTHITHYLQVFTPPRSLFRTSPPHRSSTIRMRVEAAATSHSLLLPPPFILSPTRPDAPPPMPTSAPTSFPPLSLPSDSRREADPRADYGFELQFSTDTELGAHMREFESMVRRDTDGSTQVDDEAGNKDIVAGSEARATVQNLLETDRRRREEMRDIERALIALRQAIIQTLNCGTDTTEKERFHSRLVTTRRGSTALIRTGEDIAGQVTVLQDSRDSLGSCTVRANQRTLAAVLN
ncbi:hypothetical protein Tco_0845032 [Tanacetum coccineum]